MATFLRRGSLLLLLAAAALLATTATGSPVTPHTVVANADTSWGDEYHPKQL
jgi:hypothetical protein